jgi:tRNA-(ms[2]io[6]A)-hydroxylase
VSVAHLRRDDLDAATADLLSPVLQFLRCPTPAAWVEAAAKPENLQVLLVDHANCERKAAESALATIKRYGAGIPGAPGSGENGQAGVDSAGQSALLNKMSRLAREELRHFEQVQAIMQRRNVSYCRLSAARYAAELKAAACREEPGRLVDTLLIGAIIEARSCERFAALVPVLDAELAAFYASLLKSESRHFRDYLALAEAVTGKATVEKRLDVLLSREAALVSEPDVDFRFHSGAPISEK